MALTDPQDTLAYHMSRPFTVRRDMSKQPLNLVTLVIQGYNLSQTAYPETEALRFYGMNHGMAEILRKFAPMEPLPLGYLDFVQQYHALMGPKAVRAFYYLLLICTREARHVLSYHDYKPKVIELFGYQVAAMFSHVAGGESGIHHQLINNPPSCTCGQYCDALAWLFYNAQWSDGFGGPAWGAVADCLCRFVRGDYTPEMMLDTIWTLCHNNGPIFNKPLLYKHYDHKMYLKNILDLQRAGYIPTAILTCSEFGIPQFLDTDMKLRMEFIRKAFPSAVPDYIDWFVVEALGALSTYDSQKQAQLKKHGMSMKAKEVIENAKKIAEAKIAMEKLKQEEALAAIFEVHPGLVLQKVKMKRKAA